MAAFFQSITTRTAGFETIPQKNFTDGSAMVSMILMFIGGSPMGTAGGVKTITVALLIVLVTSYISGNHDTVVWGRKVVEENIRSAVVIFFFALTTALTATILLVAVSGHPLLDCSYEVVSAVATVGLTRSLTSQPLQQGKSLLYCTTVYGTNRADYTCGSPWAQNKTCGCGYSETGTEDSDWIKE
ncbi:MAG: potassium transporter TrkG [Lachnospiraceae bacterium]